MERPEFSWGAHIEEDGRGLGFIDAIGLCGSD